MVDVSWLSQEAKNIHAIFESMFYGMAILFVLFAGCIQLVIALAIASTGGVVASGVARRVPRLDRAHRRRAGRAR